VFYAVQQLERAVAVELTDEQYAGLMIEPPDDEDPVACAQRILLASARARGTPAAP
jgi:hypothetical protein